jgi:hypothetical protein
VAGGVAGGAGRGVSAGQALGQTWHASTVHEVVVVADLAVAQKSRGVVLSVIGRGIAGEAVAVVVAGLATVGAGHTGPVVLEVVIETSACVRSNSRVDNSVIGGIARGAGSWIGTGKAAV